MGVQVEIKTDGVPPQDVKSKIIHRQSGRLLCMNRGPKGTMIVKDKSETTGADEEFWSIVPLETSSDGVPTKARFECQLKQDGNVEYQLVPSKKYPGCFRFYYGGKLFIGHEGDSTAVSTTFGDISAAELDQDIWFFEYTPASKVVITIDVSINEIVVKLGALLEGFLNSSGKKALQNLAHALDLAVDEFAAIAKASGRVTVAKLAVLQTVSDAVYEAIGRDCTAKELGEILGKFLRNMAEIITEVARTLGAVVGLLVIKMADFVEKFLGGIATAVASGVLGFVQFLSDLNGIIFGISGYLTGTMSAALLKFGIDIAVLAEAFTRLVAAFGSIKLDDNMTLGSLTPETAIASLSGAVRYVFTCFGGFLQEVTYNVEHPPAPTAPTKPETEGPLFSLTGPIAEIMGKVGELISAVLKKAEAKAIRTIAFALEAAVDALIVSLKGIKGVSITIADGLTALSDLVYKAATSVHLDGLGTAICNLLKKVADIVGDVLGDALNGIGAALKNLVYQIAIVVEYLLNGVMTIILGLAVGGSISLGSILAPIGVLVGTITTTISGSLSVLFKGLGIDVQPLLQIFGRLSAAISAQDLTLLGTIFADLFGCLGKVFTDAIGGVTTLPVSSGHGSVSDGFVEIKIDLIALPLGEVFKNVGQLILNVLGKAGEKVIRTAAFALDAAIDALIIVLKGLAFIPVATLTLLQELSDKMYTAATSLKFEGLGGALSALLSKFGFILEGILGDVVVGLGLAVKTLLVQLGTLVEQLLGGILSIVLGVVNIGSANLKPVLAPIGEMVNQLIITITGTLGRVLQGLGLVLKPLTDALGRLSNALVSLDINSFGSIFVEIFSSISVIFIGVFQKVGATPIKYPVIDNSVHGSVSGDTGKSEVTVNVDFNFELVAEPFGLIITKVGELLLQVLNKGGEKLIRDAAFAVDVAVDALITLLKKFGVVTIDILTLFDGLSNALYNAATSVNSEGLGIALEKLLRTAGDVLEILLAGATGAIFGLGLALKNVMYGLGSLVGQLLQGVLSIIGGLAGGLYDLGADKLGQLLTPLGVLVSGIIQLVSGTFSGFEQALGITLKPFTDALGRLAAAITSLDVKAVISLFSEIFGSFSLTITGIFTVLGRIIITTLPGKVDEQKPPGITTLPGKVDEQKPPGITTLPGKVDEQKPPGITTLPGKVDEQKPPGITTLPGKVDEHKPPGITTLPGKVDEQKPPGITTLPGKVDTTTGQITVTPPKGDFTFEIVAEPFGLILSKLGELLLNVLNKTGDKVIRAAAFALDAACEAFITLLAGFDIIASATLTVFGNLSDAVYKAATSVNFDGLGKALCNLLNMLGDMFEGFFGAVGVVVVGLGRALKDLLYQLGSLVNQFLDGVLSIIVGVAGGLLGVGSALLGPILAPIGVLVNTIISTVTGTLGGLLKQFGLNLKPFTDALGRLAAAITTLDIKALGGIFVDVFGSFSIVIIGVFKGAVKVGIPLPGKLPGGSTGGQISVSPPKGDFTFEIVAEPFGLILSKLGELLLNVLNKTGDKVIRAAAFALDAACEAFITLLAGFDVIASATLTVFGNLSDAVYKAATSVNFDGLGKALCNLLNMLGDMFEGFFGAVGVVVVGLGRALKDLLYQLGSLVNQFLDGVLSFILGVAGGLLGIGSLGALLGPILAPIGVLVNAIISTVTGTLGGLLKQFGLNLKPFTDALGRLAAAITTLDIKALGGIFVDVFGSFSIVIIGVFKGAMKVGIPLPGKLPGGSTGGQISVSPPKGDFTFEIVAEPFGLILSKLGELLLNVLNKTGEKLIRAAAFALDAACEAFITLLAGFDVIASATLTVFGNLSDAVYKAATSVNFDGLGKALCNLLNMLGDMFEGFFGAVGVVVVGLGRALKDLLYQLGSLVNQFLDGVLSFILGVAGGLLGVGSALLGPILAPIGVLVNAIISTVTGTLGGLLKPFGLNLKPFTDALGRLAAAITTLDIKALGGIFVDIFGSFSIVIIGVFKGAVNVGIPLPGKLPGGSIEVTPGKGEGAISVSPPKGGFSFEIVAEPFGLILSKLGELLLNVLNKTGDKVIRAAAFALDAACEAFITLLAGFDIIASATLTAFGNLSDAVYKAATSVKFDGLGKALCNLLNMLGDMFEGFFGAVGVVVVGLGRALKDLLYQLGSLVNQFLDGVLSFILGVAGGLLGVGSALLGPILAPIGVLVNAIISTVTGTLGGLLKQFGLNLKPFTDALGRLAAAITTLDIKALGGIFVDVFGSFSIIIIGVFKGAVNVGIPLPGKLPGGSIEVTPGKGEGAISVSPPKGGFSFEIVAEPFGLILSKLGELLLNVLNKAGDKVIRAAAFALDAACDALITLFAGFDIIASATLTAFGHLSDAVFNAAISVNFDGLGKALCNFLNMLGDVFGVIFGGVGVVVVGLGLALKNLLYQLGSLVNQLLDGVLSIILGVAGGILGVGSALLGPILAPIGVLVNAIISTVTGTLRGLLKPFGLNLKPFTDALGRLAAAITTLDIKALGGIFVDIFGSFSIIIIGVFKGATNVGITLPGKLPGGSIEVTPGKGEGAISVSPPKGDFHFGLVAEPFGLILSKLGELLVSVLAKAGEKVIRAAAFALDAAVDGLITVLAGFGIVVEATLKAFGDLSDAVFKAATSVSFEGLGKALDDLIDLVGDVLEIVLRGAEKVLVGLGFAIKNLFYQIGNLVHDLLDGILSVILSAANGLLGLTSVLLRPILAPIGFLVDAIISSVTGTLAVILKPLGLKLESLGDALGRLGKCISTLDIKSLGPCLGEVFGSVSVVIIGIFQGIEVLIFGKPAPLPIAPAPKPTAPVTIKVDISFTTMPIQLVLNGVGKLVASIFDKAGERKIRDAAMALDTAVDALITKLRTLSFISVAAVDALAKLSDALYKVATSNMDKVGTAISNLLLKLADILVDLFGAANKSLSQALKAFVQRVASLVQNLLDGLLNFIMNLGGLFIFGGADVFLAPIMLPIGAIVDATNDAVTTDLATALAAFGLSVTSLTTALNKLKKAITSVETKNLGAIFVDIFSASAAAFLVINFVGSIVIETQSSTVIDLTSLNSLISGKKGNQFDMSFGTDAGFQFGSNTDFDFSTDAAFGLQTKQSRAVITWVPRPGQMVHNQK
ncbi:hypothetical protein MPTK1_3g19350 [Marchantia polymorpha subsp. ruderalis]|uniref:Uncharacterized protein n=2 Tax=Marchantia polymorpha TaxID=3197 RepID=A0AAF6B2I9_MARPO|nr:hypothetical protein MARPO_0049s0099 [Marchantia polymorpha]BBN06223.1 hypothetical protein Mp_3g19350 [Marchantia polymorpha subsp. ruderalis]|eukprot:PTQ38820.1 hypothetical protein MARPO_0049s0099 [Marchantia polymorpha]